MLSHLFSYLFSSEFAAKTQHEYCLDALLQLMGTNSAWLAQSPQAGPDVDAKDDCLQRSSAEGVANGSLMSKDSLIKHGIAGSSVTFLLLCQEIRVANSLARPFIPGTSPVI